VGAPEMVIFSAKLSEGTPKDEAAWRGDGRIHSIDDRYDHDIDELMA
jgi:hypothetical protein